MTVHDVGSSYLSWKRFTNHPDMADIKARCLFLHVSLPGQSPATENLNLGFPSMQSLGLNLVTVLDQLRIQRVVAIGDGAGGNIVLRFGMFHPGRIHGIILINTSTSSGTTAMKQDIKNITTQIRAQNTLELNEKNVVKYADSFKKRDDINNQINSRVSFDVLMVAGIKFRGVRETEQIQQQIKPGLSSLIKIGDVDDVLEESPSKLADSLILFCQGLGLFPTVRRRSLQASDSCPGNNAKMRNRRMSMEQYDIPNIRRLSISSPLH